MLCANGVVQVRGKTMRNLLKTIGKQRQKKNSKHNKIRLNDNQGQRQEPSRRILHQYIHKLIYIVINSEEFGPRIAKDEEKSSNVSNE